MRKEHFVECKNLQMHEVEALIKKANQFGLMGKEITHIYEINEDNHKDFLFEVKLNNFLIETET